VKSRGDAEERPPACVFGSATGIGCTPSDVERDNLATVNNLPKERAVDGIAMDEVEDAIASGETGGETAYVGIRLPWNELYRHVVVSFADVGLLECQSAERDEVRRVTCPFRSCHDIEAMPPAEPVFLPDVNVRVADPVYRDEGTHPPFAHLLASLIALTLKDMCAREPCQKADVA
jgi:hypothetical protein